jgi:tetratricopeptide (TPR) repeat protein
MATRRDQRRQRKKKKRADAIRRERHLRALPAEPRPDAWDEEDAAEEAWLKHPLRQDHRAEMELTMRRLSGLAGGAEHEAQELAYRAMQAADEEERRAWLRRALEVDPECVDALSILARMDARSAEERAERLQEVVAIAARRLGPDAFEEGKGHFWGLIETRPYMRARTELAWTLLALGREDEAIEHVEEMLELNPRDNQGLRYTLLGLLLLRGELDAARALVERFDDDISPTFAWGEVLIAFLDGDLERAAAGVVEARADNPHAEAYLVGERIPPPREKRPPDYNPCEETGAWVCCDEIGPAWKAHPKALRWLRSLG